MKQKKRFSNFSIRKQKSYLTAGVITLTAVIAMAGVYHKRTANNKEEEQEAVIMAESEWTEDTVDLDVTGDEDAAMADEEITIEDTVPTEDLSDTITVVGKTEETIETFAQTDTDTLNFSEGDALSWPVNGDVILNYSMDQSVYFATLDQYKYNPALVIQSEVNTKVNAAAKGQVIRVDTTAETGETVSVDIGGGYQLVYGQLKDVQLAAGDYVEEGSLIGFISEPTKYYSIEGSNLYFEMLKDGEPVNPLDYLN